MGLIINKTAILASALTVAALYFGQKPLYAFLLGAIILLTPIRFLIPGERDKKIISETGIISSLGVIFAFTTLGLKLEYSLVIGIIFGYLYLVWWIFAMPRFFKK